MAKQDPGTVAPTADVAEGVVVTPKEHPELRRMIQVLAIEATQQEDVAKDFVFDILESVLAADSFDDVFAAQDNGMMSGKDFTNRPFYLTRDNITWMRSTKEGGLPFYALMKVTEIATGEEITVNCGGQTFVTVLFKLSQLGYFDQTDENPLGRAIALIGHESPNGAYLTVVPFKVATATGRGSK